MTILAIGPAQTRGFALSVFTEFDFESIVRGVDTAFAIIPDGSYVQGGRLSRTEAFDSSGGDDISVGDGDDDERFGDEDAQVVGDTPLQQNLRARDLDDSTTLFVVWNGSGTAATQGAANVNLLYADPNYQTIIQDR